MLPIIMKPLPPHPPTNQHLYDLEIIALRLQTRHLIFQFPTDQPQVLQIFLAHCTLLPNPPSVHTNENLALLHFNSLTLLANTLDGFRIFAIKISQVACGLCNRASKSFQKFLIVIPPQLGSFPSDRSRQAFGLRSTYSPRPALGNSSLLHNKFNLLPVVVVFFLTGLLLHRFPLIKRATAVKIPQNHRGVLWNPLNKPRVTHLRRI